MKNQNCSGLLLEQAAAWFSEKSKQYRIPLVSGTVFGLLAYMFAFTNKLINHDDVSALFSKGGTHTLGRWGLDILEYIFPNYSMPWIYGIITILLITISACVMINVFSIRSKLLQSLLVGSILTFPSLTGTFTYMFTSSSYAVSFLLAAVAVWLLVKMDKRTVFPALVCMIGSLSIYQSYVAIAAGLLVLDVLQRLLKEEEIAPIIRRGIGYVVFLIVSLGLYYGCTMVINRLLGIGFSSYASGNLSFSFTEVPSRILLAYQSFPRFFTEGYRGLMPTALSRLLHTGSLLISGLLLLLWAITGKKLQISRVFFLVAMLMVLPLAINCMYLFTTEDSVHTLVLYGFVSIYVLIVILAEAVLEQLSGSKFSQLGVNALSVLLALIIAGNIYLANEVSLLQHLRYENAVTFYTGLISDLRSNPDFTQDTKLAIVGNYQEPAFYLEKFPFSDSVTGTDGFLPDVYSKGQFLEYYLGFPIPMAGDQEISELSATEEFMQMPVYPYYGSVKMIDNTLVVKLS